MKKVCLARMPLLQAVYNQGRTFGGFDLDIDELLRILNEDFQMELEATLVYTRNSLIMR